LESDARPAEPDQTGRPTAQGDAIR